MCTDRNTFFRRCIFPTTDYCQQCVRQTCSCYGLVTTQDYCRTRRSDRHRVLAKHDIRTTDYCQTRRSANRLLPKKTSRHAPDCSQELTDLLPKKTPRQAPESVANQDAIIAKQDDLIHTGFLTMKIDSQARKH